LRTIVSNEHRFDHNNRDEIRSSEPEGVATWTWGRGNVNLRAWLREPEGVATFSNKQ
jgi:hypothetical protein